MKSSNCLGLLLLVVLMLAIGYVITHPYLFTGCVGSSGVNTGAYSINDDYSVLGPDLTEQQVNDLLQNAGSPAQGTGSSWVCASTHTHVSIIFALGVYWCESNWDTNKADPNSYLRYNPGNMYGISGAFNSWDEGISAWMKNTAGWYSKGKTTIKVLLNTLTPPGRDGNASDADAFPNCVVQAMDHIAAGQVP